MLLIARDQELSVVSVLVVVVVVAIVLREIVVVVVVVSHVVIVSSVLVVIVVVVSTLLLVVVSALLLVVVLTLVAVHVVVRSLLMLLVVGGRVVVEARHVSVVAASIDLHRAILSWRSSSGVVGRRRRRVLLRDDALLLLGLRDTEHASEAGRWRRWELAHSGRLHGRIRLGGGRARRRWRARREEWTSRCLHDGWVRDERWWQRVWLLGLSYWLAHVEVLDVRAAEDDVLKHFVAWQHWSVRWSVLGTERAHFY